MIRFPGHSDTFMDDESSRDNTLPDSAEEDVEALLVMPTGDEPEEQGKEVEFSNGLKELPEVINRTLNLTCRNLQRKKNHVGFHLRLFF